ncbi:hypothetical protein SDC9_113080 [bioreactor metagenome]|uniref:Uncharacterized protein n=1 Tax=bioreactor metagenome TaxID=1076179 RepID=A0A645BSH2_9ZZZZ
MQPVDLTLQAMQAYIALGDGLRHGRQVGLRVGQQLAVLLQAQARGLLLELEFGDALTQRVQRALGLHAPLVAGAQLRRQAVVLAAALAQRLLTRQLQRQRVLQATLRGGGRQA